MAGLLFAVSEAPGEAARLVGRGLPRMLHFPWLRSRLFTSDHFAAACVLPERVTPTLWHDAGGDGFAAIFGEYYPQDRPPAEPGATFDEIRRLHAQGRARELKNRNGLYNLLFWDAAQRTLLIANDTTGALLLFHASLPGGKVWCSEPGVLYSLPGVPEELDDEAVESLVRLGYQAGNRTVRKGVRVFPPATVLRLRLAGAGADERAESGDPLMGEQVRADYESEFPTLLRDAVRLRLRGELPVRLPLSGGEDSRLLLAVALELGADVSTFTLDGCQVGDAAAASRVAALAGVAHTTVGLEREAIAEAQPFLGAALASTTDWHPGAFLALLKRLGPGSTIPLGFLGGTFSGAFIGARGVGGEGERLSETLRDAFDSDAHGPSCVAPAPTGVRAEMLRNLYGRQRKYTSFLVRLAWNFGRPVCALADRRLIRLGLSLSRRDLHLHRARRLVFRRHFPHLAGVVNGNDGLAVSSFVLRRLKDLARGNALSAFARRLLRRATPNYDVSRLAPLLSEAVGRLPEEQRRVMKSLTARATILQAFAFLPLVVCHHGALDLAAWQGARGGQSR